MGPGGTWWDPGGMPGGTLVAPFRTLFRLEMPGQAWLDLVGPSQTLGMPVGTWWDPGDAWWDLMGPRGCPVGHFRFFPLF